MQTTERYTVTVFFYDEIIAWIKTAFVNVYCRFYSVLFFFVDKANWNTRHSLA